MSKIEVDLHSHTHFSDGKHPPAEMLKRANKEGLDVLAITDHNTVFGIAQLVPERVRDAYGVYLIHGFELSLATGHYLILGTPPHLVSDILQKYYITERSTAAVTTKEQTMEILQRFLDLGSVNIVAHPCLPTPMSTNVETLIELYHSSLIHGAEVHNYEIERHTNLYYKLWHRQVKKILDSENIPSFKNSDAHHKQNVGKRRNIYENTKPEKLLSHLRETLVR